MADAPDLAPIYEAAGKEWNVDPRLLRAQGLVESSGNVATPDSPAGAQGVAQIMPATGAALGVTNPYDPAQAIFAQAKLMRQNLDRYKSPGDALRAYVAGTDQAKWGTPEAMAYVPKVIAAYQGLAPKTDDSAAPAAAAAPAAPAPAPATASPYAAMSPDDFFAATTGNAPAGDGVTTVAVKAKAPPAKSVATPALDATVSKLRAAQAPAASPPAATPAPDAQPSPAAPYAAMSPDDFFAATTGSKATPPAASQPTATPSAPSGAPTIAQVVRKELGIAPPAAPPSWLDRTANTTVEGLAALQHGLTFGLDRPINALANAAVNYFSPGTGTQLQQSQDQARQQFETDHPIAAPVLTAIGSMPTYATGEGAIAGAIPKMAGSGFVPSVVNGARAVAKNAFLGGTAGYGLSGGNLQGAEYGALGGVVLPAALGVASRVGAGVAAGAKLALPIPATTNSIANAIVDKFAGTPLERLNTASLVPGSQPTLAEAAGIPGISRLQNGLADADPVANNLLAARAQANAAARTEALNAARGNESDLQSAVMARDAITPGKVFANKQPTNAQPVVDEIKSILGGTGGGRTAVQSALGKLQTTLTDADGNLLPAASDPEYLYNSVRKQIGDQLDKADLSDASGRQAARELLQVRDKLDDAIEAGAPGFGQYRADYAAASHPIDAMKWLQSQNLTDANGNVTLQKVQNALRNLGKQTSVATSGANDAASVTAEQRQILEGIRDDLLRSQGINLSKGVGSDTVRKAATQYALGQALPGPLSLVGKVINPRGLGLVLGALSGHGGLGDAAGYGIGAAVKSFGDMRNAQVRDRLTQMMLDPSLYTPGRVVNPLLPKLQPYAVPLGITTGNPLLQGQQKTP